jgi:hypothetical protein
MSLVGDSFRDYRTLVSSPIIPTRILSTPVRPKVGDVIRTGEVTMLTIEKPLPVVPCLRKEDLYDQVFVIIKLLLRRNRLVDSKGVTN